MLQKIKEYNKLILEKLSIFLNETPNAIKKEMINDLVKNYDFTEEKAFAYLLSSFVGIDLYDMDNFRNIKGKKLIKLFSPEKVWKKRFYEYSKNTRNCNPKWYGIDGTDGMWDILDNKS